MKRFSLLAFVFAACVIAAARPASAQMIVSDPETEFETYTTAFQTAQQYATQVQQFSTQMQQWQQQLKDGQLINESNYSNYVGDMQNLVNALNTSGSNQVSVNNGGLSSSYATTYAGYTPQSGDPGESEFSSMIGNQLAGVLQALQANQATFTRANANAGVSQQLASENNSDSGTDALLQTTNAILIGILEDIEYEQSANAVNMQALLASTAGDTEVSAQDRAEFSSFLQNEASQYANPPASAGF